MCVFKPREKEKAWARVLAAGCLSARYHSACLSHWRIASKRQSQLEGCIVLNEHNTVFARSGPLYVIVSWWSNKDTHQKSLHGVRVGNTATPISNASPERKRYLDRFRHFCHYILQKVHSCCQQCNRPSCCVRLRLQNNSHYRSRRGHYSLARLFCQTTLACITAKELNVVYWDVKV